MTPSQLVSTPNGLGRIQGAIDIWDRGAHYTLLVRHVLKEMTGTAAGLCQTPKAQISGLWAYEARDVKEAKEEK